MSQNYMTDRELANEALRRAEADPMWAELTAQTPLETCGLGYPLRVKDPTPLVRANFETTAHAVFGGNEGIYARVNLMPDPRPNERGSAIIYMKTLNDSKQDFLNMQILGGLVAYHAREVVNENIHRFN